MATSLADALTSTGMIPPVSGGDLQQPDQKQAANTNQPKSEADIVNKGMESIKGDLAGVPKPPEMIQYAKAPEAQTSDAVQQGYVSAIGIMGAIGSAFTRRPMVNAMNSAAAVVKSMKEGDQEAFKQNMEKWKIDNENIKNMNDYQQQAYKSILENTKLSIETKMGMMTAQAAAFNDPIVQKLAQQRNDSELQDILDRRADAYRNYQLKKDAADQAVTEAHDKNQLYQEGVEAHPEWTPEQKAMFRSKVFDPSVAAADVRAEAATAKATQKATNNDKSIDTVVGEIDQAIEAAKNSQTIVEGVPLAPTGLQGIVGRAAEGLSMGKGAEGDAPGAAFKEKISLIAQQAGEIIHGGRYSNAATKDTEKNLASIGALTSPKTAESALNELKKHLLALKGKSVDHQNPKGSQHQIGDVVTSPDGKQVTITGFDEDGTPLGEEVK